MADDTRLAEDSLAIAAWRRLAKSRILPHRPLIPALMTHLRSTGSNDKEWDIFAYERPSNLQVYIASSITNHEECRSLAKDLSNIDRVQIASTWHGEDSFAQQSEKSEHDRRELCDQNYEDLDFANVFVFLPQPASRGSLIELGYALKGDTHKVFAVGNSYEYTLMAEKAIWVLTKTMLLERLLMMR